jgi:hypothetical protein
MNEINASEITSPMIRYPLHSEVNGEKKMDLYIYELEGRKIAYLSLAKCASNEIRNILKKLTNGQTRLNINVKNKNDKRLKNLVVFSFLRNPWERFHSAFNMIHGNTSLGFPDLFLKFTENPDKCTLSNSGHWTPQYDQLITENGELLPKYIGNMNYLYKGIEDLISIVFKDDITKGRHIINKLKIIETTTQKVHILNKDFKDDLYYLKYYNKITHDNVKKYLKIDIELFNVLFPNTLICDYKSLV